MMFRVSGREARRRGGNIYEADLVIFSIPEALSFPERTAAGFAIIYISATLWYFEITRYIDTCMLIEIELQVSIILIILQEIIFFII